ncbi:hypothetical protein E4U56_000901 [Claviceps arundinis]|uniref:Uncharacterized protein n=1 Tax=Claviceps arundinis TaxID=1623583 RepID=A0A9P7SN80_9HYPO|nr:hypothetical protein E4U56_000901 [Claviceps arundinis]
MDIQLYNVKSGDEFISTSGSLVDVLFRAIQLLGGPPPETWSKLETRKIGNTKIHQLLSLYDRVKVWEVREANRYWSRTIPHDEKRLAFLKLIK